MKIIENKTTEIKNQDGADPMKYSDLCVAVLRQPVQGGLNYQEMGKRIKLIETIEKSKGNIELEDADHATLKGIIASHRWPVLHADIHAFCEDTEKA